MHLELEVAELERHVALWLDEAVRFRVRQWNDRQWNRNVWEVRAAVGCIVFHIYVQAIIIGNVSRVRRWRHLRQHEDFLRRPCLWIAAKHLLSLERLAMVLNSLQVELHLFHDLRLLWIDTASVLVLNEVESEGSPWQVDSLRHLELHLPNPQVLIRVVDGDDSVGYFVGVENILVEVHGQIRSTLWTTAAIGNAAITAAACQSSGVLESRVGLELDWRLVNNQHLLVFEILF